MYLLITWTTPATFVANRSLDPGCSKATWGHILVRSHLVALIVARHLLIDLIWGLTCKHIHPSKISSVSDVTSHSLSNPTWTNTTNLPASRILQTLPYHRHRHLHPMVNLRREKSLFPMRMRMKIQSILPTLQLDEMRHSMVTGLRSHSMQVTFHPFPAMIRQELQEKWEEEMGKEMTPQMVRLQPWQLFDPQNELLNCQLMQAIKMASTNEGWSFIRLLLLLLHFHEQGQEGCWREVWSLTTSCSSSQEIFDCQEQTEEKIEKRKAYWASWVNLNLQTTNLMKNMKTRLIWFVVDSLQILTSSRNKFGIIIRFDIFSWFPYLLHWMFHNFTTFKSREKEKNKLGSRLGQMEESHVSTGTLIPNWMEGRKKETHNVINSQLEYVLQLTLYCLEKMVIIGRKSLEGRKRFDSPRIIIIPSSSFFPSHKNRIFCPTHTFSSIHPSFSPSLILPIIPCLTLLPIPMVYHSLTFQIPFAAKNLHKGKGRNGKKGGKIFVSHRNFPKARFQCE